jgi:ribosome-binding factor A
MRVVRINELIKREISSILHTRYRESAVRITVSEVDCSPDLKEATAYYGVVGRPEDISKARHFFSHEGGEISRMLSKVIVLRQMPHIVFRFDPSMERGAHLNEIIDSLGIKDEKPSQ